MTNLPLLLLIFSTIGLVWTACQPTAHNPHIIINTELGPIEVEIYADKAPITANNFLRYVRENRLQGTRFYRTVTLEPDNQPDKTTKIEVIQGGFALNMVDTISNPLLLPPIAHETTQQTGLSHTDGTISMARDKPGTAQAEFFICIGDQPELDFGGKRNPDGVGFAAFGKVVGGMDIVRKIHRLPNTEQMIDPPLSILSIKIK